MIYFLCKLLQHWFFCAAFYAADCLMITDSQPRRTGAFTTSTPLNNVKRINPKLPQTPWCDSRDSDRRLDKCQAKPSSAPHKNTTTTINNNNPPPPPGWFQDGGIWMCGCMCLWFHFVDVWLCCWQTSVAHASHAALERNSGKGGEARGGEGRVGGCMWKCQPWSDFPARLRRAAVITSRWNTRFHSFHLIPKRLPPPHLTPLIQTLSSMQNYHNSLLF